MATREEVLTNLTKAAKQGNIRDAYRDFEELPFVDQVAISISPGIGDALAVYEIGEFGARGAKNIEEKDFLGALGNYGLSGLSAISILPLFRLFRGAKAIKAIDPVIDAPRPRKGKTGLKGPGEYQAEQAAKKATENLPLPKVEEFKPLSLNEMVYPGTLGRTIKNQGLTSKAAKFINTSNKLPVQGKLITYINALEKAGVPKGELRLLNILDEANEIHPKLLDEMGSKSGLDKITRQRLSQYIKTNQKDAISKRMVAKNKYSRQIKELGDEFANIKENTFHVRGITRKEFDHYSEAPHKDHFVFDSTSEFKLPNIPETEKITEFIGGDNFLNVARVQSDYAEEMGILAKNRSESQIDSIKRSIDASADRRVINNMAEYKLPSDKPGGERINMENFAIKIARENPQITSPEKLRELFIKKAGDKGATRESFGPFGNDFSIDDVFPLEAFETIQKAVEKAQKKFPVTPYIDGKAITSLKKALNQYNNAIPEINNLSLKQADLQKKIDSLELTPDSPSIVDLNKELDQIKKTRDDLIGEKVVPNIDEFGGFTLSPEELKNITGKPFTESLDKSLDEIFYEVVENPNTNAIVQKYGPGTPGERALNYFNEIVNNDKMTFDIGNGINILKRATKIKPDRFSGYPIDPYAKGTRTNYIKLPIRSNFLEAVEEGKDGMYFDSAAKRLGKEGGWESELLQGVFREGENEIDRIIRELGLDPKDYVLKPKDIEFKGPGYKFDGTYVKIDEALRKLVKEKGIDAFQAGGPVDDDLPDVGSIIPIGPSRPSRSTEYKRRLAELEDFIAKNRLVSKEAQMSLMSGEGYTDPRFFKTTGNPLIDQYGMRPFPAEGSGQILSTTELGMGGKKELFNIGNPGKYRPIADTIVYKDISDLYKNTDLTPVTPETTQKHEFFHRAAERSGWINNFHNSPYLKKNVKLLSGENGRILKPLINEAVAHSYEYDKDYSKDKELKKEINFRASKFNLKDPKKIADEIFDNIEYLRDDFEKYLEEVTVEYLPENVNSYTTTRTNKSTGGEIQSALDEFGIKPKNIYTESLEIDQIANNPLIEKLEFNAGGPVDESKLEQTERRLDAGEEIDDILKDLYGTAIANEFGEYDYNAPLRNFQDSIEKNLSNQFDFKYKDDLMDIYKSDDPGANIENRARKFSTNYINSLLDDLNLPVDVRRDNYGTNFDKIFNVAPNTNVTLDAYKSDDGDFTGDLNLRYSNRGKYGNIDLQSEINELGDTQDKIKYNQDIGPFSIQAGKTSGRDATGSVSYNLPSMSVGNAQTIQARAVIDNLLNAKGQLDYMYNNPNTGYFVNAGLGLNSQRGPEFNLKFGKNF
jgi:hypothetical protein